MLLCRITISSKMLKFLLYLNTRFLLQSHARSTWQTFLVQTRLTLSFENSTTASNRKLKLEFAVAHFVFAYIISIRLSSGCAAGRNKS